jgi:hypothetical protein
VGDRAGPGFGIRIDPLPLRHEQEDRAQLRGLHPLRLYRRDHPTHSQQELPARALLRVVAHRRGGFSSSASCAFSGSGKRGWACNPAPTRRAKRPSIHGSTAPSRLRHRTGHGVLRHLKPSGSARVRLSHPLFSDPSPPATAFSGCGARTRKSPSLTSGSTFVTLRPMETHAFGFRPPANAPA